MIRFIFIIMFSSTLLAQKKEYKVMKIAFYNVENLYDTIESVDLINGDLEPKDPKYQLSISIDSAKYLKLQDYKGAYVTEQLKNKKVLRNQSLNDEFTPDGKKLWNTSKYKEKLKNIAQVLSGIGNEIDKTPPVIIGLCEIENRQVLTDLINQPQLKPYNYGIIHFNSMDERGVDTALLYQKQYFMVTDSDKIKLELWDIENGDKKRDYTRDILKVRGLMDNEEFVFYVNHWPSRRGGEEISMDKRMKAAELLSSEIKSLSSNVKVFIMGDFNDDPTSESIKKGLNTTDEKTETEAILYNPFEKMYKKGVGTLAYKDAMNLFDQIMVNQSVIKYEGWFFHKAGIYSPNYLITPSGSYKGYPFRSYSGDAYTGGYSDHFPAYVVLIKEINLE